MKCLAITGGIGSGKSYVAKIFAAIGVPVYIADLRAKSLYDTDKELLDNVVELLGESVLLDGKLDKARMASIVFKEREKLLALEDLVHPAVLRDFFQWKSNLDEEKVPLIAFESAIYFEKAIFRTIGDKSLFISSPLEVRVERALKRDGVTKEKIYDRIRNQMSDEKCLKLADYVIVSNNVDAIMPQVVKVYNKMIEV